METMRGGLTAAACLPADHARAVLVGRVWLPDLAGPVLAQVTAEGVYDLSSVATTASELCEHDAPAASVLAAKSLRRIAAFADVLANARVFDYIGFKAGNERFQIYADAFRIIGKAKIQERLYYHQSAAFPAPDHEHGKDRTLRPHRKLDGPGRKEHLAPEKVRFHPFLASAAVYGDAEDLIVSKSDESALQ